MGRGRQNAAMSDAASTVAPLARPGETVAGYRVVRKLGSGRSGEVHLAYARDRVVAVKLYRHGVPAGRIHVEIDALSRPLGAHAVRLLDIGADAESRPVLVLERLPGPDLAGALERGMAPGEVVTALVPIAELVAAAHAAGVCHGALGPAKVLLSSAGAPVLIGWGRSTLFDPAGSTPRNRPDAVLVDLRALATMVHAAVQSCVPVDLALKRRAGQLTEWLVADAGVDARELAERLFRLTEPLPIAPAVPGPRGGGIPARLEPMPPAPLGRVPERTRPGTRRERTRPARGRGAFVAATVLRSSALPVWLREAIDGWLDSVRRARAPEVRGTRRRLVPGLIAAGAGIAAILALSVLTGPSAEAPSSESTGYPAEADQADTRRTGTGAAPPSASAGPDASLAADPERAAAFLLAERERCLRELSQRCLDRVVQEGSAAEAADRRQLELRQRGESVSPAWPDPSVPVGLVQRLGDSALLSTVDGEPASLLLVRGEAGWRIRDYLG